MNTAPAPSSVHSPTQKGAVDALDRARAVVAVLVDAPARLGLAAHDLFEDFRGRWRAATSVAGIWGSGQSARFITPTRHFYASIRCAQRRRSDRGEAEIAGVALEDAEVPADDVVEHLVAAAVPPVVDGGRVVLQARTCRDVDLEHVP